ncbi:MAG: dockerin type I domain-containing protein, partial [Pirellulaceae bacterium]|nr:dockerin type I domain-containing protein [Pirellulaceae bacterium]
MNNDLFVAPLDVLQIINDLRRNGTRQLGPRPIGTSIGYIDVTGDGFASPVDVLNVINILNSRKPIVAAKLINDSGTTEAAKF